VLTEAARELGGRAATESRLPGLHAWRRVVEYREQQLGRMANVGVYLQSPMTAGDILEQGFTHVVTATGSSWRRDGVGRWHTRPILVTGTPQILTPDDLMAGQLPAGPRVLVFDDDHYYLGGVLAELLAAEGYQVRIVTPSAHLSAWTANTLELVKIRQRVMRAGVVVEPNHALLRLTGEGAVTTCVFTGEETYVPADAVVLVTARLPTRELYVRLKDRQQEWADSGIISVQAVGDAWAPGTIAAAVWAGRRYAEELDAPPSADGVPFRRELTALGP
jgi:dimethylamine/trimethylamine dehydrogenase